MPTSIVDARNRGGEYLATAVRQRFTELVAAVHEYYKLPAALLVCGHTAEAAALVDWIRAHGLTPDGDFGPRLPQATGYCHTYFNAWIIQGAHRLGAFDLSQTGAGFLLHSWDGESGGFFSSVTETAPETLQDLWVTCGAAQALLYSGHLVEARGAGGWLERLLLLQPNYPRQMFTVYSRARGLHTTYPPEQEIRYVLHPDRERDEFFFNPGIAGGFLASLYCATGERRWLSLAEQYLRPVELASDAQWRSLRAGKVGWAAAQLYRLTRLGRYRDVAERVAAHLIAQQAEDGAWKPDFMSWNDATAEMVVWLDEIAQALSRPR